MWFHCIFFRLTHVQVRHVFGKESFDVVRIGFGHLLQGQTISAYNSLIISPRGLQCETNLYEIMGWESSDVVRFDLGPLLQVQKMVLLCQLTCTLSIEDEKLFKACKSVCSSVC